jgi:hypothetical protein
MIQLLASFFRAVAETFGWARERSALKNNEPMVKGKVAQEENEKVDAANKAVARNDLDEIRKQISE